MRQLQKFLGLVQFGKMLDVSRSFDLLYPDGRVHPRVDRAAGKPRSPPAAAAATAISSFAEVASFSLYESEKKREAKTLVICIAFGPLLHWRPLVSSLVGTPSPAILRLLPACLSVGLSRRIHVCLWPPELSPSPLLAALFDPP